MWCARRGWAGGDDTSTLHHEHMVAACDCKGNGVGDEDACAAGQETKDALLKEMGAHMRVDGGEHVIEDHDVRISVARARQVDALLLATTQVDSTLACAHRDSNEHLSAILSPSPILRF